MNVRAVLVPLLLGSGILVELLCCLGILVLRRAADRLHFLGPASFLGPGLIALAFLVNKSGFQADFKAIVVFLALLIFSPIVTHAAGRAIHLAQAGAGPPPDGPEEGNAP